MDHHTAIETHYTLTYTISIAQNPIVYFGKIRQMNSHNKAYRTPKKIFDSDVVCKTRCVRFESRCVAKKAVKIFNFLRKTNFRQFTRHKPQFVFFQKIKRYYKYRHKAKKHFYVKLFIISKNDNFKK